jgi:hypothetical protein
MGEIRYVPYTKLSLENPNGRDEFRDLVVEGQTGLILRWIVKM